MNPYTSEYRRLQMRLNKVRADLKDCNFLGYDWQRLDKEESRILNMMKS
jgi:hypothetical protein